jgi:hypothetical protein
MAASRFPWVGLECRGNGALNWFACFDNGGPVKPGAFYRQWGEERWKVFLTS